MKIIREGEIKRIEAIKRFECWECGCVFECSKSEYEHSGSGRNSDVYTATCPTCKHNVSLEV